MARPRKATVSGTSAGTYLRTHPWITFSLDLKPASYLFWMDLGAVQSKIEHVANALLPPKIAKDLYEIYMAKGVHATTAIEGNTLSESQVHERIVNQAAMPESKAYLDKEIDNIVDACNAIRKDVLGGKDARLERIKDQGV